MEMLPYFLVFLLCAERALHVMAQGDWLTQPFNPPSMPLAVKSPYVNAWDPLGSDTTGSAALYGIWPRTWDTANAGVGWILGWYASIRVDGEPYNMLGDATPLAINDSVQQSFYFSPTRSSYLLQAGTVNVNVTFMTSIEPTDIVRQSMPFTYLYFDVQSNDGNNHSVQIYSDISGEWISGNDGLLSNWTITESSNFVYLQMGLQSPGPFQELNSRPMDATAYYCMKRVNGISWQIGTADVIRSFFANGTGLNDTADSTFHAIGEPAFDTLAIAVDLGSISSTSEPVSYALGVVRDPVVQYTNNFLQIQELRAYYWSQFSDIQDVIEDVLDHFDDALSAAISLDNQILGDAGEISGQYAEILALATRQAMGALEYTINEDDSGSTNNSKVMAFMKDMGGIGSGGVNAVDVLYASMPVYLYLNPNILGYLLSPLLNYQESPQYTNLYAAQDLGGSFPNATGDPNSHNQKIEHTASMLIMSLAHAQASGDGSLLSEHYDLLNSWASYLVNYTMNPGDETTSISDGITAINQTNLVLKGIIGIGAMAKISSFTGNSDDEGSYDSFAKQYIQQWTSLASSSNQIDLTFESGLSGLIYNLYADKLLQLNLVDSSVYSLQTSFYQKQTQQWKYGIPLDLSNSSSITRSDWMMFAASSVTDDAVRNDMISQVHAYASINQANLPFPVIYNPASGSWTGGEASPAQGAMFAPLALNVPITSSGSGGDSDSSNDSGSSNTAVIASVSGVVGLGLISGLIFFFVRRRRVQAQSTVTLDHNHTDRIGLAKPAAVAADSVLGPLSETLYSSNVSYPVSVPFHVRNLTESELTGSGDVPVSVGSSFGVHFRSSSTRSAPLGAASRVPRGEKKEIREMLQSEVDDLRREIDCIREESRVVLAEPPPSYDDDIHTNPNPWSLSRSTAKR